MTLLRKELIDCIQVISEEKLLAIKPLLLMLSNEPKFEPITLEKLNDSNLTEEERKTFENAETAFFNGECIDFEEYLIEREVTI